MLLPSTLPRTIFLQAALVTLVTAAGLLALMWLLQSLHFLDLLVNKGLGIEIFLKITSLLLPRSLVIVLPLALLAGVAFTARRLQDDQEITALLASGAHPAVAFLPLLAWAGVVMLLLYGVMVWLQPLSIGAFKELQQDVRTRQGQVLLEEGTFNPLGDNLMVYIKRRLSPTSFEQLLVHDTRNPATPVTWYARFGQLQQRGPNQAPQLMLQQGMRQQIGEGQSTMLEFTSYTLDLSTQVGAENFHPRQPEVEELPLKTAWQQAHNPATAPKRAARLQAEVVNRLSWPLLPLPLALVAVAALLHPPRRKQSSVRGVMAAGGLGVAIVAAQFGLFTQLQSGADWAMIPLFGWPLLAAGMAWFYYRRVM